MDWAVWRWRVQGSGRYLGDSEAPDYVLSNTGIHEVGGSASVGFRDHRRNASVYYSYFARELGILRASNIGNLTDLDNAISSGEPWYVGDFTYAHDRLYVSTSIGLLAIGQDPEKTTAPEGFVLEWTDPDAKPEGR